MLKLQILTSFMKHGSKYTINLLEITITLLFLPFTQILKYKILQTQYGTVKKFPSNIFNKCTGNYLLKNTHFYSDGSMKDVRVAKSSLFDKFRWV